MQKQAKVNSGQMRENDWLHSNVSDRLMPRIISCPAPPSPPPTSTTHHSTSMEAIDKAIASLEAHRPVVKGQLKKTAEKYGVNRSTLGRRWRGRTGSRKEGYDRQRKLHPQQELELVKYIEELGVNGLAPTREMVRNFASNIAQKYVRECWVSRFLTTHQINLTSKWTTGINRVRHQANSGVKYHLYFELIR
jgi:hypothetical protein